MAILYYLCRVKGAWKCVRKDVVDELGVKECLQCREDPRCDAAALRLARESLGYKG
jgi:hypothetical protein